MVLGLFLARSTNIFVVRVCLADGFTPGLKAVVARMLVHKSICCLIFIVLFLNMIHVKRISKTLFQLPPFLNVIRIALSESYGY